MVLPQYTFAALAFGALAAIAVTLYATLGSRPNRQQYETNSDRRGPSNRSSRHRPQKCDVCQKRGDLIKLPCNHTYHKSCIMNLHGPDIAPECAQFCVVCWEKISKETRVEIESKQNTECSICLDCIENESLVLECGHEYHNHCAKRLIEHSDRKCPNCRMPIPQLPFSAERILKQC